MNRHLRVPEVRVSGAPVDEDSPAALPPFALTLPSIPRRRHSWICGNNFEDNVNALDLDGLQFTRQVARERITLSYITY
ncbi:unnamed protein product [Danaus chrysippus]|uniref:(African queen) hypothetical protein n=1 Tax=Danaus chrysippus TaxID=151541 RepID=A0A8J2VWE4_9NEOP|nr:unnamed protein product [Danaus chrysippus]